MQKSEIECSACAHGSYKLISLPLPIYTWPAIRLLCIGVCFVSETEGLQTETSPN